MSNFSESVDYTVETSVWPNSFRDLVKAWGFRSSKRSADEFPIWMVLTGKGFSIWLSEVKLADSTSQPPKWSLRIEALSELSDDGRAAWHDLRQSFDEYFIEQGFKFSVE